MSFLKTLVAATALTIASGSATFADTPLSFLTEEYPPFNFTQDGEIVGIATDLITEAADTAGVAFTLEMQPWARAFAGAKDKANTCVFSTALTEDRKPHFKWVAPLNKSAIVLIAHKDRMHEIAALEDARGLKIGTYKGDVTEQLLVNAGFEVDSSSKQDQNIKKLKAGRIDVWSVYRARFEDLNDPELVEVFLIEETVTGLACNPSVPDAQISAMQSALDTMIADGKAEAVNAKYK